jgi:hypothetical protein
MQTYIGWWACRRGKWHFVESEVTDRLVMRCGRQMKLETKGAALAFQQDASTLDCCEQCTGRRVAD